MHTCKNSIAELSELLHLPKQLVVEDKKTCWTSYYNSKQNSEYNQASTTTQTGTAGTMELRSQVEVPPEKDFKPQHIDNYLDATVGVWHPDVLFPNIAWSGGGRPQDSPGAFFNPFVRINHKFVVSFFTEQLSDKYTNIQWALEQHGHLTSSERGNQGIANQDLIPQSMTKPEYLAFTALRAQPNQQLRNLSTVLCDRTLPFTHLAVQTLVRQTVYHCGDIYYSDDPEFVWKTDLREYNGYNTLFDELQRRAEELAHTPRDRHAIRLLGEVAAYLSQWHLQGRTVVRTFIAAARRFGDLKTDEIQKAEDEDSSKRGPNVPPCTMAVGLASAVSCN